MEVFNFCWMTLVAESKKSNVFFDKNTYNVKNDIDENFNKPLNRISYLYKFGSYNISLFYQCFQEFCEKVPDSAKIIDNFRSLKNLTICSMSAGPGTDIIGFLYSLHRINKPLVNAAVIKVISRHGAWRNLVTEMINSSIINVPDTSTCKLIECDFLKDLSEKAQGYLKQTDILLMCNSFESSVTPEKVMCDRLKMVTQLLKPGALVFFIFSKEKSTYFKELLSFGSFLYEPVEVALENMPYNEKIVELVEVKPLCSGTSLFAVWQKSHDIKHGINLQKETQNNLSVGSNQHSLNKLIKSDIEDINSPTLSLSNLKREFSSDSNISSSDIVKISSSLGSSSQFSSSSISSQVIDRREKSVDSDNSVNFTQQNIAFSKTNFNNSAKNISPASLDASGSSVKKKYALPCRSAQKKIENNGKDMDSLLKSFESLITKFEGLISSEDSLKHSHVKEKQPLCSQHCHQNMHQGHCRCSVTPCQFNENHSMCCCHSIMCYNYTNVSNHNCSTSAAHNLYRTLPQEGPCIVIPLQNLSDESLTHILSIVSQNTSVNKTTSNLFQKEEKS